MDGWLLLERLFFAPWDHGLEVWCGQKYGPFQRYCQWDIVRERSGRMEERERETEQEEGAERERERDNRDTVVYSG